MESNFFAPPHRPTSDDFHLIPILSIDGGGIRGIIPGVILKNLEEQLQRIDKDTNPNAKLADYFDVIAGTSTGGLVATMLTTPKEPGRNEEPKYAAKDIAPFYLEKAPKIFDQTKFTRWRPRWLWLSWGPLYNGEDLKCIVNESIGKDTRLSNTLTNVVIPTFDIRTMRPVIFSSFKVPDDPNINVSINASMYDICLGTSAAPTYLPGNKFNNYGYEFNLVDGGVAANNPTAVAIEELLMAATKDLKDSKDCTMTDRYSQFLVLSIGTGSKYTEGEDTYDVDKSSKWGALGWLAFNDNPLYSIFTQASDEMVDYRVNNIFQLIDRPDQFLRIQDDTLAGDLSSVDIATEENLKALEQVGTDLLGKPVRRLNPETGNYDPVPHLGTNRDALKRFAKVLSDERKSRIGMGITDLATKKASVIRLVKQNMGIQE